MMDWWQTLPNYPRIMDDREYLDYCSQLEYIRRRDEEEAGREPVCEGESREGERKDVSEVQEADGDR